MPEIVMSSEIQLPVPDTYVSDIKVREALDLMNQALILLAGFTDGRILSVALTAANPPITTLRTSAINRMTVKANGAIGQGAPVYFSQVAGELQATVASAAATTTLAMGYCSQPGGVANGAFGEFTPCIGVNKLLSGLSLGSKYYLTNAGGYSTVAGTVVQYLGVAITTSALLFHPGFIG